MDSNTYFYIGKGKGDRYKRINCRSKHFKNIINNFPCVVEILYENLTEEEAFELETKTIEQLLFEEGYTFEEDTIKNKGFNHLVNCTCGGEGISGYKHTNETKKKCTHYGKENGMYGLKGEKCPHYGKNFSKNHKEKIMVSNPKRKEVYCIELNRYFKSYREAERILLNEYGIICSHATISSICKGKLEQGGYYKENKKKAKLHFVNI